MNCTPTRDRDVRPAIGSFSALPSWIDAAFMSIVPPEAAAIPAAMSSVAVVAWLKMSLPAPTSLRMFLNVSSMFSPDCDHLVVDAGLARQRRRQAVDLLGRDVRRAAGGLQHGVGLLHHVLGFLELLEGVRRTDRKRGQAGGGDLRAPGEPGGPRLDVDRQRGDRWRGEPPFSAMPSSFMKPSSGSPRGTSYQGGMNSRNLWSFLLHRFTR